MILEGRAVLTHFACKKVHKCSDKTYKILPLITRGANIEIKLYDVVCDVNCSEN